MARMNRGILGGFSGTVGTVTGSHWKGREYIRGKMVRKSTAVSQKQAVQRAKFKLLASFLSSFRRLLSYSFKEYTSDQTGRNYALQLNKEAVLGEYPTFHLDYSKIQLSGGAKLDNVDTANVEAGPEGTVTFSWEDNSGPDTGMDFADPDDRVIVIVYCPALGRSVHKITSYRSAEVASFKTPFRATDVHTWLAFISEDLARVSNSRYVGLVTLE